MPQLRRLRIEFSASETEYRYGDFDFGIQHLSCLTRVHAAITEQVSPYAVEAAITEQVSKNPNSPVLELSREIIAPQEEHETVQESYEQESRMSDKHSDEEHATLQKQHEIMELDVDSNTNKQADSRISTLLSESSSHLVNPDVDSREVEKKQADSRISTLPESSSRLPVGGADPESVLTAAVINHPSNPKINPQSVDWILCGDEDIKKVGSKPAIMTEEEDAMVSASTGAMNSLLVKLATLLGEHEQYAKLTGTRKELVILKDELDAMKTLLEQLAGMAGLSAQTRDSRNQMREMTYDIEDCIDDLMVQLSRDVTTLSNDHIIMLQNFTDQIYKLKAQLEEADLGSMVPRTEMRSLGPSNGLVGMDGPRDELVRRLSGDEQDKLRGVCILGVAGIGKTMLATQVYNEIKRRFDRCVFISASEKVGMARLCRSILLQLQETINSNRGDDVEYLIGRVRTNLRYKRFLIVIDGVWSAQIVEDIIKDALPEKNRGSRIITTSGIRDVAEACGKHFSSFTYPMEPLTFEESLGLFRSIIFGSGRSCPVASEKVEEIVKACGGIPLALRLIAGALASKPAEMEQWVTIREKIMKQAGTDDHLNVEWMRKIFDISYSHLSCDMKTCLLYLSAFPENHVIRKDRLIGRWVAEGFLLKRCGKTWWETGESYFLELVARNLVNPVYDEEDVLPIGCEVSGSVLDFITSLSSEENFVKSDVTDPTYMQHGVVRRLSVDLGSDNQEKPLSYKVRSLTFVDDFGFGRMPDLSAFKHVRVLDLKDNKRLENEQLESIGRLSLLSYLGLGGTSVTKLPQEIMALEQLTTLDIRRTRVRKLPEFRDTKLVFLLADELIVPRGMGGMQKLEELSKVLMGPDGSFADDVAGLVNKLRRLRMLGVRFSRWYAQTQNEKHQQEVKHFVEEVVKSNLQSLFLDNYPHHLLNLLVDSWAHKRPHHLREIELRIAGCLPLVPKEMASLIALTHLHINVEVVGAQCVRALGNLPNLVLLKLVCSDTSPRLAVSSKDGFQCLKVFCYWSGGGMGLQFEAGAMPQLRRLVLDFNVRETISRYGDFDFGVQHLSYLVQVRATMRDCLSAPASEVEANMRDQVSQNPNHPVLEWKTRQCSTAPAEGSVIAIHGLDEWFIETEEANLTNKLVVIFFTESSCVPSVKMVPVFADLAKKLPNVVFLKVDLDVAETRHIVEQFGVDGSPTFLFMKGGLVKDTLRGANTKELAWKLEAWE